MNGSIERSTSLFVCQCGNKIAFAVGMNHETMKMDVLLCTACKTVYAWEDDDPVGFPKPEAAKVLH